MVRSLANTKVLIRLAARLGNTLTDGKLASVDHPNCNVSESLESGADTGQANIAWQWASTITAGNTVTIDLYDTGNIDVGAGAGRDGVGLPLTIENLVALLITNESDEASLGVLEVSPSGSAGFSGCPTLTAAAGNGLKPGGLMFVYQPESPGMDITDGVSHKLDLKAVTADVDFRICLLGRHDDEVSSSSSSSASSSSASSASSQSVSSWSSSSTS